MDFQACEERDGGVSEGDVEAAGAKARSRDQDGDDERNIDRSGLC